MKKHVCHGVEDYTALLYCVIFDKISEDEGYSPSLILNALDTLTERERRVIELRYRYNKTYAEIGAEFEISGSRAEQIEAKALKKLRNPNRNLNINIDKIKEDRDKYIREVQNQRGIIEKLNNNLILLTDKKNINEFESDCILDMDVKELGISICVYNSFKRKNITTIRGVYNIKSLKKLYAIPNVGVKTADRIIETMRKLGFENWADKMLNNKTPEGKSDKNESNALK